MARISSEVFGSGVIRHSSPRRLIASRTRSFRTPRNRMRCFASSRWSSSSARKARAMLSGSGRIWIAPSTMMRSTASPHSLSLSSCVRGGSPRARVSVVQMVEESLPLGDMDSGHGHERVVAGERRGDPRFQLAGRGSGEGMLAQDRDAGGREVFRWSSSMPLGFHRTRRGQCQRRGNEAAGRAAAFLLQSMRSRTACRRSLPTSWSLSRPAWTGASRQSTSPGWTPATSSASTPPRSRGTSARFPPSAPGFPRLCSWTRGTGGRAGHGPRLRPPRCVLRDRGRPLLDGLQHRAAETSSPGPAPPRIPPASSQLRRRRIIDTFTGTVAPSRWDDTWPARLADRLAEVFALFERGGESVEKARQLVNEMAAAALGELAQSGSGTVLYPVRIEVSGSARGPDTHARALAGHAVLPVHLLHGPHAPGRLHRARHHPHGRRKNRGRVRVRGRLGPGHLGSCRHRQDQALRAPHQAVHLVPSQRAGSAWPPSCASSSWCGTCSPCPGRDGGCEMLSDQGVLRDLAQLLGASTFLWEDFVRLQYEELLPMLAPQMGGSRFAEPIESLRERLDAAACGRRGPGGVRPTAERVQGQGDLPLRPRPHPHLAPHPRRRMPPPRKPSKTIFSS